MLGGVVLIRNLSNYPYSSFSTICHGATSLTTVKHLSAKQVNGIEIPLPPLAEQHRIVAKVNELMTLCGRLEVAQTKRETTRNRLATASLARLNASDSGPGHVPESRRPSPLRILPALQLDPIMSMPSARQSSISQFAAILCHKTRTTSPHRSCWTGSRWKKRG